MTSSREAPPPPVRIDVENEWAWCGERRLSLTPRAFAVLRHLVARAGRLVTKDDLLSTVWRDAVVSDAALASCIRDLRRELDDASESPRYIETVHRRGFRFLGPVAGPSDVAVSTGPAERPPGAAAQPADASPPLTLVGREAEIEQLHAALARAMDGRRQVMFVTGEPGIGKTALVESFLSRIGAGGAPRIGRGQCVEQYGAGEAYLPALEALGRMGRGPGSERVVSVLKQHAPTWLTQLTALVAERDLEAVERRAQGASRDRMLREVVEALDALSADEPLVLVLEDLHWSDSSTIDLLGRLARRRDPARLLILGTYRPADVAAHQHPLGAVKQELEVHGQCEEMALGFLDVQALREYLARRFPGHELPSDLPVALHRSTGGNPLFAVNTVDDWVARGQIREVDGTWRLSGSVKDVTAATPATLSQMVTRQIEGLTAEEQATLAAASVAGAEFSAALVAADVDDARGSEERCDALARRGQFLRAAGAAEWPDGTVAGRYAFVHALYQQVLYASVPAARRAALHLRTGERLEWAWGARAGEIAGELAVHFENGRDVGRAVRYRRQAAENALRQHGYREAAGHARRSLDLLAPLPVTQLRVQEELTAHVTLGTALTATKGYSALEVERTYGRALELCGQVEDNPRLFPVLLGLGWFYLVRGPSRAARDVGNRLEAMAGATRDPAIVVAAHNALGLVSFYEGEFDTALGHLEQAIGLYDPGRDSPNRSPVFRGGLDPGLSCTCHAAWTLWALGYPARAVARMVEALALARSLDHPFTLAHAGRFAATFHLCLGEPRQVQEYVDGTLALSTEHSLRLFYAVLKFHRGWIDAGQGRAGEGLAEMGEWVDACRAIRADCLLPPYLAWLGEAHGRAGRPAEGLELVNEALAVGAASGYRYWTAELHRLRGTLALRAGPERAGERDAESHFAEALAVSRGQKAKLFELRAATELARLWAAQGRTRDARALLSEVYGWFTEGFETADLRAARTLLDDLDRGESPAHRDASPAPRPSAPRPRRAERR